MHVIDVDDPASWPESIRAEAEALATDLHGTTVHVGDLELPDGCDDHFREMLRGRQLLAYHATRLLPHEIEDIRSGGLRPLTSDLVDERIRRVHAEGYLSCPQAERFARGSVFSSRDGGSNRSGQVCFFLGEDTFKSQAGLWRLLSTWGGEAIYWEHNERSDLVEDLRRLGTPTIVVAGLRNLESGWRTHAVWPELPRHFVGTILGLESKGADVFYRSPVPGSDVLDLWTPGHSEFDSRLAWLEP